MIKETIDAFPRKKLFIDILTQDVNAEECILDLIDNSVDSYVKNMLTDRREIRITLNGEKCEIYDNCGGIEKEFLKQKVFRFGTEHLDREHPTLGMYGIGLKRSVFKMGNDILFETDDGNNYSLMQMDVREWERKEKDWSIPFETDKSKLSDGQKPYTKIRVSSLHDEIKEKFSLDPFISKISDKLRCVYYLTMQNKIDFVFNENKLEHYNLIVPYSDDYKPSVLVGEYEGVRYRIICFIDPSKGTRLNNAINQVGWNIFCNERLILANDKSKTTGWRGKDEAGYLPKYHPIFNEFRGHVFMEANNPFFLPLNTAKSDLNTETKVYHHILEQMTKTAKPVIDYLSKKYSEQKQREDEIEEDMETTSDNDFKPTMIAATEFKNTSEFKAPIKKEVKEEITNISYSKPKKIVDVVKKHLGVSSNKEVGIKTFDYFVDAEDLNG